MKQIFSKKSKTKGPDKAYPICMDSIQGTEGPKADWDEHAEDKFDRCVEKVKEDSKDMKDGDPCWKGYEMVGMKEKNGKEVPNCVPKKSSIVFDIFKSAQEEIVEENGDLEKKLDEFKRLVAQHDLTYEYSDDSRYYNAGRQSYSKIRALADQLPEEETKRIWNAMVDRKLVPNAREQFYWR